MRDGGSTGVLGRIVAFAAAVSSFALVAVASDPASGVTLAIVPSVTRPMPPFAHTGCPVRAAYLRLAGEVRGYELDGFGRAYPCVRLGRPSAAYDAPTSSYGGIAIDAAGDLHISKFQDNGYDAIADFEPLARGDERAYRSVGGFPQDHVAFAIDARGNDFLVGSEAYESDDCWFFAAAAATTPALLSCDPALASIKALATIGTGVLIVAGPDAITLRDRIDVFAQAGTTTPRLVRSIVGPSTGLALRSDYFAPLALAIDRASGELFVYAGDAHGMPHVLVFAARASGDAAPVRTIDGPALALGMAFASDPIAIDDRHRLYAVTPSGRIVIFAAGASGRAAPIATIDDPTIPQPQFAIGLALRTSQR